MANIEKALKNLPLRNGVGIIVLNKENKVLRHLITVIKKDDALIAADKMDEVPETNRNRR